MSLGTVAYPCVVSLVPLVRLSLTFPLARTLVADDSGLDDVADGLDGLWSSASAHPDRNATPHHQIDAVLASLQGPIRSGFEPSDPRVDLLHELIDRLGDSRPNALEAVLERVQAAFGRIERHAIDDDARAASHAISVKVGEFVTSLAHHLSTDQPSVETLELLRWRSFNVGERLDQRLMLATAAARGRPKALLVCARAAQRLIGDFDVYVGERGRGDAEAVRRPLERVLAIAAGTASTSDRKDFQALEKPLLRQLPKTEGSGDRTLDPPSYAVLAVHGALIEAWGLPVEIHAVAYARSSAYESAAQALGLPRESIEDVRTAADPAVLREVRAEEDDLRG
jgi:hypothetical protein